MTRQGPLAEALDFLGLLVVLGLIFFGVGSL